MGIGTFYQPHLRRTANSVKPVQTEVMSRYFGNMALDTLFHANRLTDMDKMVTDLLLRDGRNLSVRLNELSANQSLIAAHIELALIGAKFFHLRFDGHISRGSVIVKSVNR